ncbi:hypothetical protein [Neisseria dumasiana]|nr:hypothetical protein [Neisseria dumasiana]
MWPDIDVVVLVSDTCIRHQYPQTRFQTASLITRHSPSYPRPKII